MEKNRSRAGAMKNVYVALCEDFCHAGPKTTMCGVFRTRKAAADAVAEEAWAKRHPDYREEAEIGKMRKKLYCVGRISVWRKFGLSVYRIEKSSLNG